MPKVNIQDALAEKEADDVLKCKTCSAPSEDGYEPYCRHCYMYWQDCNNGLYDDISRHRIKQDDR
jgi:hypothetical protein